MAPNNKRLHDLLSLSHVPRWTTHPMTRPQSVADHSFRVAVIAMELFNELPSALLPQGRTKDDYWEDVIVWSLVHDAPEAFTGDIPSPAKKVLGSLLKDLEAVCCDWWASERINIMPLPKAVVHMSDTLEALSWVSKYGDGANCRWEHITIEQQIRKKVHDQAAEYDQKYPGFHDAVNRILGEIAP